MPQYPGSRGERMLPLPMADVEYGPVFLNTANGLGLKLIEVGAWQVGTSVWFRRGRRPDQGAKISNLGTIGTAAEARVFSRYSLGPFVLGTTIAKDFGGSSGLTVELHADWRLECARRLKATLGLETSYGSGNTMQAWFGVTPAQAVASGLVQYSPGAGFEWAGPSASIEYSLTPRWNLGARLGYDVLVGQAADSPVIDRRTLPAAAIAAAYRFAP